MRKTLTGFREVSKFAYEKPEAILNGWCEFFQETAVGAQYCPQTYMYNVDLA